MDCEEKSGISQVDDEGKCGVLPVENIQMTRPDQRCRIAVCRINYISSRRPDYAQLTYLVEMIVQKKGDREEIKGPL